MYSLPTVQVRPDGWCTFSYVAKRGGGFKMVWVWDRDWIKR